MHAYSQTGEPCYFVTAKNGNQRATTIADCRKHGYLPSVTEILNIVAKPALTNWLVDQGIMAALTLPRIDGEPEPALLKRIKTDAAAQGLGAMQEGNRIHDALECHFRGSLYPDQYRKHVNATRAELWQLFPGVTDWISEASFGHPLGYGGKADLHSPSTGIVVDFKGKDGDFTDGKKLAYDQHLQLSAYQQGLQLPPNVCANIFVSRSHPGCVASHVWSMEELADAWTIFTATLALWKAIKKYDPAFHPEPVGVLHAPPASVQAAGTN